jgi:hypothetical protein
VDHGGLQNPVYDIVDLRHPKDMVEQEAGKMPIYIDILENKILGREYKRGLQEGELNALRRIAEPEDLSVRALDAQSHEELLR